MTSHRHFVSLVLRCVLLIGLLSAGWSIPEASARSTRVVHRYLVQVLVQTPHRFSVPNAKVFADGRLLGVTDRFGIFVGFLSGIKGQRVKFSIRKKGVGLLRQVQIRLRTKITGTAVLPTPVKLRFQLKGAKNANGRLLRFPIRVFALTPDRVGISKAKVFIDGKMVGHTNKFGLWVGQFKSQSGEVIQIKVVGRGKGNHATMPARLRLGRQRRPAAIKFHAYIRP